MILQMHSACLLKDSSLKQPKPTTEKNPVMMTKTTDHPVAKPSKRITNSSKRGTAKIGHTKFPIRKRAMTLEALNSTKTTGVLARESKTRGY
ncbi:hypothetical protein BCR41DRAFT_348622 [Lobosporangium transversale]|uniref:Uncharacterized protein n=1 Tax=Lobosporangium transversale TaxID=64571 RepID=A0A1Y2GUW1_9FUNG|nr:hypothetical protein BCR41DRAFT_348622 [Lobosporangium transversale]ORZ24853.1 hypothetical protein BCR41DRAFT_348622 [Lobosporangium transversale]|eukprot:XP_021883834.1 hypothetical protein BCR41DRAFT_348622 [Lobosporangium transversale]